MGVLVAARLPKPSCVAAWWQVLSTIILPLNIIYGPCTETDAKSL